METVLTIDRLISLILNHQKKTNGNNDKTLKTIKWCIMKLRELTIKSSKLNDSQCKFALKKKKRFDLYTICNKMAVLYRNILSNLFRLGKNYSNLSDSKTLVDDIKSELLTKIMECHCALTKINMIMVDLIDRNGFQMRADQLTDDIDPEKNDLDVKFQPLLDAVKSEEESVEYDNEDPMEFDFGSIIKNDDDESDTMDNVIIDEKNLPYDDPDDIKPKRRSSDIEMEMHEQKIDKEIADLEKEQNPSDSE